MYVYISVGNLIIKYSNLEKYLVFLLVKNMVVKAKKFLYVKQFDGEPKITDFELVEEVLPDIKDGGM